MNTQVLCPKCILSGDKVPVSESSDEPLCLKGHNLNSKYDIQSGQTGTSQTSYNQNIQLISQLDDKECPRYFVLLPLNDESLGFINRLVNTVLFKDGYAIHFLCESPESLHFTGREGYKLEKPKPLFEKYGPYLYHILAVLSKALPHGGMVLQHGGGPEAFAVGQGMKIAAEGLSSAMDAFRNALEDNMKRYPEISRVVADLKTPRKVDRPIRRELCAFLNLNGKGDDFGGLYPVLHDGKYLWLCRGCYDKFEQKEDQLNLQ